MGAPAHAEVNINAHRENLNYALCQTKVGPNAGRFLGVPPAVAQRHGKTADLILQALLLPRFPEQTELNQSGLR